MRFAWPQWQLCLLLIVAAAVATSTSASSRDIKEFLDAEYSDPKLLVEGCKDRVDELNVAAEVLHQVSNPSAKIQAAFFERLDAAHKCARELSSKPKNGRKYRIEKEFFGHRYRLAY